MRLEQRFWDKVDIRGEDECWLWHAGTRNGYGQIKVHGKIPYAHRVGFELVYGPIPEGICVLHSCDTPLCCNPEHWFLGTHQDNMDDKEQKNRHNRPIRKPLHTRKPHLTEQQVRRIRFLYRTHTLFLKDLSLFFNVNISQISRIVNRKAWKKI